MPLTTSRSDHLYVLLEHSNTGLPNAVNRVEFKYVLALMDRII